jgi:hypothetical protein
LSSHPKFRLSIWLRGRLAVQAVGLRQLTKGMRKPEFQKIGRIKAALFIRNAFWWPKIFWILVRLSMSCRRMSRVSLVFFVPYHQPVDLSATTPLPNAYYFAFCHADNASKTRSLD